MKERLTAKPYYKWIIVLLAFLIVNIKTFNYCVTAPLVTAMMDQSGWSVGQAGQMTTSFYLIYAIGLFTCPTLVNRLGTRKTCLLNLAICTVTCLLAPLAGNNFLFHNILRGISGFGFGLYISVPGVMINTWFPPHQQSAMQGVRASFDYVGGYLGYVLPAVFLAPAGSWQKDIAIFGWMALALFVLFFVLYYDKPKTEAQLAEEAQINTKRRSPLGYVLTHAWPWFISVGMLGGLCIYNTFGTYSPALFELEKGMDPIKAANVSALNQIGSIAGALIGGALAAKLGKHKINGILGNVFTILGAVIAYLASSTPMIAFGSILCGFGVGEYMTFYFTAPALIAGPTNPGIVSASVGLTIGMPMLVLYFYPQMIEGMMNRGLTMAQAMLVFAIPAVICTIPLFFMKEFGEKGKYALRGEKAYEVPENY